MTGHDCPYAGKTIAEIVHDFAVVRGDLSEQYARDQLVTIIEERLDDRARSRPVQTLTEFLLARIAEDEAFHQGFIDAGAETPYDRPHRRILRECGAKRRIIETAHRRATHGDDSGWLAGTVLSELAAVYSDHPDYREEWKP